MMAQPNDEPSKAGLASVAVAVAVSAVVVEGGVWGKGRGRSEGDGNGGGGNSIKSISQQNAYSYINSQCGFHKEINQ